MKTFQEFVLIAEAAYDASVMGSSQIRRGGDGTKIGADRKKTAPERRRTKRGPGGTTVPAKEYKPRKDIGQQRQASTRVQQPEKERGAAALSPKEAQRKAYLERKAREGGGSTKSKDLEKQASKLLSKKKEAKPTGGKIERTTSREYTRDEKKRMVRAGKRLHKDIIAGKEKDASHYTP